MYFQLIGIVGGFYYILHYNYKTHAKICQINTYSALKMYQ